PQRQLYFFSLDPQSGKRKKRSPSPKLHFSQKTPFFPIRPTLLSHQSLPKNGYELPENVNFRLFSTYLPNLHKSRPPPIKLYIPSIIFSEPKQTSKASPPPLLLLKR
ncbi:hypothetical protein AABB24_014104, partial [Solanum stoloniferum]